MERGKCMGEKQIWNHSIEEIKKGYQRQGDAYCCLLCDAKFEIGRVYPDGEAFYDAYGAMKQHMKNVHKSPTDYLLHLDHDLLGVSEIQQTILQCMLAGKDDKLIAKDLGIASSTVRNHRFKLREKTKQAKLYLAMMESLEEEINRNIAMTEGGLLEEIHATATMVDNRYNITQQEREKTIQTYMNPDGSIKQFPAREKKKIIILAEIMKKFQKKEYEEKEINQLLKDLYEDYPTIRRALIEYGFMERSLDCLHYYIK